MTVRFGSVALEQQQRLGMLENKELRKISGLKGRGARRKLFNYGHQHLYSSLNIRGDKIAGTCSYARNISVLHCFQSTGYMLCLNQRLSNYGPRTTSGPRGVPLWSFKKDRRKNEMRITL
jgi:hypothetical protein